MWPMLVAGIDPFQQDLLKLLLLHASYGMNATLK